MGIKDNVESIQVSTHFDRITQWLCPPDPSTNLNKARELHQQGTGQWLLYSDQYKSWKATPASFLWLCGKPGSGKTILSSTIIIDLQHHKTSSQNLLYFYFNFTDGSKRSTENAIRSLITQLYHKNASTRGVLDPIYKLSSEKPGIEKLKLVFEAMLHVCGDAWIILDGLDECETRGQHAAGGITQWIKSIRLSTNVHLLVTS